MVDGTGAGRVAKDVALRRDRIVAVAASIDPALADSVVDARGLVVAPGFIDNHAHVFPVGIVHLFVNGRPVIQKGALTGEMPGRVLRGPARPLK